MGWYMRLLDRRIFRWCRRRGHPRRLSYCVCGRIDYSEDED